MMDDDDDDDGRLGYLVECRVVAVRRRSCGRCREWPARVSDECSESAEELTNWLTTTMNLSRTTSPIHLYTCLPSAE